jgi:hypothetical protein
LIATVMPENPLSGNVTVIPSIEQREYPRRLAANRNIRQIAFGDLSQMFGMRSQIAPNVPRYTLQR